MKREWGAILASWPAYAFMATAFALWGVSKLTTHPDGFDTVLGLCLVLVGIANGWRAVHTYRSDR